MLRLNPVVVGSYDTRSADENNAVALTGNRSRCRECDSFVQITRYYVCRILHLFGSRPEKDFILSLGIIMRYREAKLAFSSNAKLSKAWNIYVLLAPIFNVPGLFILRVILNSNYVQY